MSKSIVVINTPKNCRQCPFKESPWSFCLGEYEKEKHCPLKPMPNEREEKDHYDFGWNDCVRVLNNDYNLCKLG